MKPTAISTKILNFERDYDANLSSSESLLDFTSEQSQFLNFILQKKYEQALEIFPIAFAACKETNEQAFIIQWAVAASELRGDMQARAEVLQFWRQVHKWAIEAYSVYLKTFHQGMTLFSDGYLREAEFCFQRIHDVSLQMNYARGQIRALLHLGLVYRDLENKDRALSFFEKALSLAKAENNQRFIARIERITNKMIGTHTGIHFIDERKMSIQKALVEKDFLRARIELFQAEKERRRERLGRRAQSLYVYLPAILSGMGKDQLSLRMLNNIEDPVLKIFAYELKHKSVGLDFNEEQIFRSLRQIQGLSGQVLQSTADVEYSEICGIRLDSIDDENVKQFCKLLLNEKNAVDKVRICKAVWGLDYDPIAHDPKIYKLIFKTRKILGKSDIIANTYGGYKLNA